jgi:CheY-like chemotaxis protein
MTTKIALVDDDDAARRMMRRVLQRMGHEVVEAADGASGVELVQREQPDVLLLDLRMPGELSGFDVARELRADPATAQVPIVVVSASTHLEAKELVEQVGCDAFVEKPVDFDELERVLVELLGDDDGA